MPFKELKSYRDAFFKTINIKIADVILINVILLISLFVSNISTYSYFNSNWLKFSIYNALIFNAVSIIIIYIFVKYRIKNIEFAGFNRKGILKHTTFAMSIVFLIFFVKYGLIFLTNKYELLDIFEVNHFPNSKVYFILLFIISICVAPVIEEILYRGFYYSAIRRVVGIVPGILLSSIIFSLWHISLGDMKILVNIFLTGMLFAYFYEMSLSLVPSIVSHVLINISSRIPNLLNIFGIHITPQYLSSTLTIMFFLLSMIFFILYKYYSLKDDDKKVIKDELGSKE